MSELAGKKPCAECPYLKKSVPGYFGGNDPAIYRNAITNETRLPCHMRSQHGADGSVTVHKECPGRLLAQMNSFKTPRRRELENMHSDLRVQHSTASLLDLREQTLSLFDWVEHHGDDE